MTAIVEKSTGRLIKLISAPDDVVRLNTPEDCYATEDPPDKGMYHIGGSWQYLPPCPGEGHIFDYVSRQWIDARSLPDVRESKWNKIKIQRDNMEFGGFTYKGNVYDSDQVSQGRIMGAAVAGVDQTWTLADNTTVDLTGEELKELYAELQRHVASAHERGRLARNKIDLAMTVQDIEAVTL